MNLDNNPGNTKTSFLWALRKVDVIAELANHRVEVDPSATVAELRLILRDHLVRLRNAQGSRANSIADLVNDIDNAEIAGDKDTEQTTEPSVVITQETDPNQITPILRRPDRINQKTNSHTASDSSEEDSETEEAEELRRLEREVKERTAQIQEEKRRETELRRETEERLRAEFDKQERLRQRQERRSVREKQIAELREKLTSLSDRPSVRDESRENLTENPAELRARIEREIRAELELEYRRKNEKSRQEHSSSRTNQRDKRDIRDLVRKWGVTFDGGKGVQDFIERVDEMRLTYKMRNNQIVECIPILLKDKALLWYRNNKRDWQTWNEFTKDLTAFYIPPGVKIQIEEEIRNRTQGAKEPAKEYITKLQTLMRRYGQMSEVAKLERLYYNLRPEYKRYIKQTEFSTVNELIQLCDSYEQLVIQEAGYKPPKQQSVMPETAYNQQTKKHKSDRIEINEYNHLEDCWRCGSKGHIQAGCTNPRILMCRFCGTRGVSTYNCGCSGNDQRAGTRTTGRPEGETVPKEEMTKGQKINRSQSFAKPRGKGWTPRNRSRSQSVQRNPVQPGQQQYRPSRNQNPQQPQPQHQPQPPPQQQQQQQNQTLPHTDLTRK
ncbi:trichohyalin-like [Cotesia glomerata]|uniref:trichohyalin-like n=1 Tax=Cotesia glomerata TaxID=32391 RepID=UPI001D022AA2|nr:trichohyalin-like [Cotesia glomerata]